MKHKANNVAVKHANVKTEDIVTSHAKVASGHIAQQIEKTADISELSDADISSLLYMIEEEKMARDIYDALYEQTGLIQFDKISDSEQNHYDSLLKIADKFGIDTSTLSLEAGIYANAEIQNLYDSLVEQASVSTDSAVNVGITIEQTDIADLYSAINSTDVVLLGVVYSNLLDASTNHLNSFESLIA